MDKKISVISDLDGKKIVVIQGIPMLLQCATNKRWQENFKGKHNVDAKFGLYRFTTRFALPVYNNDTGDLERFNIFRIEMLIRHAADGNLYLYDMVNKKRNEHPA